MTVRLHRIADQDLDPGIEIYRAVNPKLMNWARTDSSGAPEMGSQCFQSMSPSRATELGYAIPAMSVALSHVLAQHHENPIRVLDAFNLSWGMAVFSVGDLRTIQPELGICEDPTVTAPWHGVVFSKTSLKISKTQSQALRAVARLIRLPARE